MSAEETSSSRCQPRRGASRTWRSSSTSRTEPRRSFHNARAGCSKSRCAASFGKAMERVMVKRFSSNGKSFDWPLLENRFTMTRSIALPKLAAHLDLLHPARALWKLRLGSVRLVELERHVLDAPR